jgi:hypothetical protein
LEDLIKKYSSDTEVQKSLKHDNEKKVGTAIVYEKIRTSLEYQEEHLLLKNAISRILRRRITLAYQLDPEKIKNDLINELSWANYLNPELISEELHQKIKDQIGRYLFLMKYIRSGHFKKHELDKLVFDWLACSLDEMLCQRNNNDLLIDYTAQILEKNLDIKALRVSPAENTLQIKIAVNLLLLKPDFSTLQYWILKNIYPDWDSLPEEELKKIGRSFDPYYNKIDRALNHPYKKQYHQYVKRNIPPFILLQSILRDKKVDLKAIEENPILLQNLMLERYKQLVSDARSKVMRGTFRALIFILITKISLALLMEIPFDRFFYGSIDYLSLTINVLLPPLLMLVAGTFVKSPPKKNIEVITEATNNIIYSDIIDKKNTPLIKKQATTNYPIFNLLYFVFSIFIYSLTLL